MDAFISYAHEDAGFVGRLRASLSARGRETWVDTEGIEPADRWKGSVQEAIERSDAFVFVLSLAALRSHACLDELSLAVSLNKRLFAICIEQAATDVEKPEALADQSWIMIRPEDDFERGVERLERALDIDLELVHTHTRILVRAKAWELADRRSSPLLRGEELASAEEWLSRAALGGSPQPTELQREFIVASRRAATRRQRIVAGAATGVASIAVALSIFALIQRSDAIDSQKIAQSRLLAADAEATVSSNSSLSTLLALRALRIHDTVQAEQALRDALANLGALVVLRGHALAVNTAVYSPDGSRILTGSDDGTARLWDPKTGRQLMVLQVSRYIVADALYSHDGREIVTASRDGTGRVWDAHTGRLLAVLRSRPHMQTGAFSPDRSRVVTGSDDGKARVWDARTGRLLMVLMGPSSYFVSVAYSPDGSKIVTDSVTTQKFRNLIALWDARTGRRLTSFYPREQASADGAALSPDGSRLAITADPMQVYSLRTDRPLTTLNDPGNGISDAGSAAFSPDGSRVLATSDAAAIWNAYTGVTFQTLGDVGNALQSGAFSPDGSRIVTASQNRVAMVWNARSYTQLLTASLSYGLSGEGVTDAAFSSDGSRIVAAGNQGHVTIFDARDGLRLVRFKDAHLVESAVFSPDGSKVLTASDLGPPRLWDARSGRQLIVFGNLPVQKGASFSPDGSKVAAGTPVGITLVWDARPGGHILRLRGPPDTPVEDTEFSSDGKLIVTANDDGTARVWDARTGRQLMVLRAPSTADFAAVFSPDGSKIAAACADGTARIWDTQTGRVLLVLTGHSDKVNAVAFSPDGSKLATASDDHTLRIWDVRTGRQLVLFRRPQAVSSVAFNRDGSEIVTADATGMTVFSTMLTNPIPTLERLARSLVTRPLTSSERTTYLAGITS